MTERSFENLNKLTDADGNEIYDIKIDRNGQWWHEGQPIKRHALAKLFSTVLKYDENKDEYWLITPAERGKISVEDVPFVIVNYTYADHILKLWTNLDHEIDVCEDHPIFLKNNLPYVVVRENLHARINRAVYYDLIELGTIQGHDISIHSHNHNWVLGHIDE